MIKLFRLTSVLLICLNTSIVAQTIGSTTKDSVTFYDMSLEQLMNMEVTVASQNPLTQRESPGILTVITAEEIRKSGATSVIDVLSMVPGFDFGVDVEGTVGLAVRGNWAHEGKVLMQLDGIDLNEELYSTLQFGGHYPVGNIKRIEIIRGPGSAMYGGNAEYAVINIITEKYQNTGGISVDGSISEMSRTYAHRQFMVSMGQTFGSTHLTASAFQLEGKRSQREFTDNSGVSYDMAGQSPIQNSQYSLGLESHGFSLSGFIDRYHLRQRDGYDNALSQAYQTDFDSYYTQLNYDWKASQKLTLSPGFSYRNQEPWKFEGESVNDEFEPYHVRVEKKSYHLNGSYEFNNRLDILGGVEYYTQNASKQIDSNYFNNGNKNFNVNNISTYIHGMSKHRFVNITLGVRFNYNNYFGSSIVPRIGLTRVFSKWHYKALYSKAFRTPSIENINTNAFIKPENTTVAELETGYQLTTNSYITANLYDITTKDAIVYFYEENNEDGYKNAGKTGTRGAELEYRYKTHRGLITTNYSYYSAAGKTDMSVYSVPGKSNVLLAFPAHRLNFSSNIYLNSYLNITPQITYQSIRYSSYVDVTDGFVKVKEFSPACYANIAVNLEKFISKGIFIQVACLNVFDENIYYIQPYSNNHAALPGTSREFKLRIAYNFTFKK